MVFLHLVIVTQAKIALFQVAIERSVKADMKKEEFLYVLFQTNQHHFNLVTLVNVYQTNVNGLNSRVKFKINKAKNIHGL
jgi:hypothetical protein